MGKGMATKGSPSNILPGQLEGRWWALIAPGLAGGVGLALAVVGAVLTSNAGGVGGLNIFVETLSGRSGTLLGSVSSAIPLGFAFAAGMVSAVNPCGFSMLPAYLGLYLGAHERDEAVNSKLHRLSRALLVGGTVTGGFVLLFGAAGTAIGAGAQRLTDLLPWAGLGVGVLLVLAGVWLLGGGKFYGGLAAQAATRVGDPRRVGPGGYFLFGVSYGIASLSCTLPIFLAVVGSTLAVQGTLPAVGQFILYSLGMGLVIMALTLGVGLFKGAVVGKIRKAVPHVQLISAWLMILSGAYIVYYWLSIGGLLSRIA